MAQYRGLCRAQLSYDYLHTNSTTHEFLFGALAELLDNARDASATKINIYSVTDESVRGGYLLCFLDDGQGMSGDDSADIVMFGKSTKKSMESQLIGMYGNGLKSGSMRIGNDFILFTKKGPTMTCVFLSRTFHEEEKIDEVIVPMPSFDSQTKKPIIKTPKDKEKHQTEMQIILKFSPFKTEAQFMKEFDNIEGDSGTLVIIYNLKLLDSGVPELDVKTDRYDIILSNPAGSDFDTDEGLVHERKSFRAYASILYVDPRMRVYIQGKKVRTKRLANGLYKPRMYKYSSVRFKTRSEIEAKKAVEESKSADNRAKEAESKARNLELKIGSSLDKEQRAELRRAQTSAAEMRKEAQIKKQSAERKGKSSREPKTLTFVFGINIENRNQDGMFIYNSSRLIKMYQKVGPQADGGVFCSGVVGFVDVPYLVLEPTHNKQDFADAKEYRHLLQAMGEHMIQYWKDISIAQQGVTKFWEDFGYINPNWRDAPSMDQKYVRKRAMQVPVTIQCDLCLKWRILPFSSNNIGRAFPDDWVCSMNPDPAHNRCSAQEEKLTMPEGVYVKASKSKEDREKDLEKEIRKKQEQLEKLNPHKQQQHSSSSKRRMESDEEDEDERDEEEEERRMSKKKTQAQKSERSILSQKKSGSLHNSWSAGLSKGKKRPPSSDGEDEYVPKSERKGSVKKFKHKVRRSSSGDEEEEDEESAAEDEPDDGHPRVNFTGRVGAKVEVKVQNKWLDGVIVELNKTSNRCRVRLDTQNEKQDKWYATNDSCLRLIKSSAPSTDKPLTVKPSSKKPDWVVMATTAQSSTSVTPAPSQDGVAETPSSSSGLVDDIANGYRTCLRYFLPPQWVMDKESVSGLTPQQLATFPLDDFFDHYERGLKKLVSSFQLEAQNRMIESEQWREKLCSLRRMIAKLLKSINEDFEIDQDTDTEQVDELLSLCVKQALQQSQGATGAAATDESATTSS